MHKMVKLDVNSIKIPKRYEKQVQREPSSSILGQTQAKIAVMTFDTNISLTTGGYACTETEAWTLEKAREARRRDDRLDLCHRHRHMHYPFVPPGMAPKKSATYYDKFMNMMLSDSGDEDTTVNNSNQKDFLRKVVKSGCQNSKASPTETAGISTSASPKKKMLRLQQKQ